MDVVRALRDAGVRVDVVDDRPAGDARTDATLSVDTGGGAARFAVVVRRRAPYPNELAGLEEREAAGRHGQALLVVPFVSEPLGTALTAAGWSWADTAGNFELRAPGLLLRQRRTSTAPRPARRELPQGSGSLAIIRALIRATSEDDTRATKLAARASVSQPRASQVLAQLRDLGLVERHTHGRWVPDRDALLDRFLAEYRGPDGSQHYLYSLDPPTDTAVRATAATTDTCELVVSADVGSDLLAAWRRPSVVILYTAGDIDTDAVGLVDAQGPHDANVIVRAPADRSVFRDPPLIVHVGDNPLRLADETQLLWDLHDLGGADRLEAAGHLRAWLLDR